ncbi:MAG: pgpA [Deltaproteobacteria bacterium]|nr:pgpA [Deltaproteobacteria bacterium]
MGCSPVVPGTMGTLLAIPIFLLVSSIPSPVYEWTIIAFFFLACWVSDKAQSHWGKKDDQRIVIDEIMGFFATMMWLPKTALFITLGFVLFRIFDILKPPPVHRLEQMRGGYGVVLDDVMAGIYANIVLQLIRIIIR